MMAPSKKESENEVPIFLRKTYHMIDSCDKSVAGWSEEDGGKTFVIKDPVQFEQKVIPTYFKHNKFSSFVRQLNFYSFRKIKFSDSIRIDYETEKKTANYWRFRHEHFQQGRPDLLIFIKRTNGKGSGTASPAANSETQPPDIPSSSTVVSSASAVVSAADKSEVQTLKKRIDEMTKNMDALTEMVQKVSLQQQHQQQAESELPGTKRKKITAEESLPLQNPVPDGVLSAPMMDLDDVPFMDGVGSIELIPPAPVPLADSRESSLDSNEFVDQLFTAFHEDEGLLGSLDGSASSLEEPTMSALGSYSSSNSNRPDPELMKRLSDALELLPKDTQEMIINRLIAAITSTDFLALGMTSDPKKVAASGKSLPKMEEEHHQPPPPTPLAAATFAALLQHYTNQIKESNSRKNGGSSSSEEAQSSAKKQLQKTIPVIPVHA